MIVGFAALLWLIPWFLATPARLQDLSLDDERKRFSWRQIGGLLRNRDLVGVLLGFFCFDYYWYFLITWLPSYFVDVRHVTILEAGIRVTSEDAGFSAGDAHPASERAGAARVVPQLEQAVA